MNLTRKDIILFGLSLISLVTILFVFTDIMGVLFVGDDYAIRAWFRCKVWLFLVLFTSVFLVGSNVLKWPIRQLGYTCL